MENFVHALPLLLCDPYPFSRAFISQSEFLQPVCTAHLVYELRQGRAGGVDLQLQLGRPADHAAGGGLLCRQCLDQHAHPHRALYQEGGLHAGQAAAGCQLGHFLQALPATTTGREGSRVWRAHPDHCTGMVVCRQGREEQAVSTGRCTKKIVCRQGQAVNWGIGKRHQKRLQAWKGGAGCGMRILTKRCTGEVVCRQGREEQAVSWGTFHNHYQKWLQAWKAMRIPTKRCTIEVVCRAGTTRLSAGAVWSRAGSATHVCRRCINRRFCRQGTRKGRLQAGRHQGKARRSRRFAGQTSLQQERRGGQRPQSSRTEPTRNQLAGADIAAAGARSTLHRKACRRDSCCSLKHAARMWHSTP